MAKDQNMPTTEHFADSSQSGILPSETNRMFERYYGGLSTAIRISQQTPSAEQRDGFIQTLAETAVGILHKFYDRNDINNHPHPVSANEVAKEATQALAEIKENAEADPAFLHKNGRKTLDEGLQMIELERQYMHGQIPELARDLFGFPMVPQPPQEYLDIQRDTTTSAALEAPETA